MKRWKVRFCVQANEWIMDVFVDAENQLNAVMAATMRIELQAAGCWSRTTVILCEEIV